MTSTPNFVVEVTKDGSSKALVLDCHYPEDEVCRVESWRPGGQWWGASRGLSWFHLADINIFWLRAAKLGRLVGGKGTRLKSEFQAINNPFSSPESGLSWKTFLFRQILSLFRLDKRMTRVTFSPSRKWVFRPPASLTGRTQITHSTQIPWIGWVLDKVGRGLPNPRRDKEAS